MEHDVGDEDVDDEIGDDETVDACDGAPKGCCRRCLLLAEVYVVLLLMHLPFAFSILQ